MGLQFWSHRFQKRLLLCQGLLLERQKEQSYLLSVRMPYVIMLFPFLKQHRTMFKDKCVVLDLIVFFSNGDDKCNVSAAT